jgi:hypothetical protein
MVMVPIPRYPGYGIPVSPNGVARDGPDGVILGVIEVISARLEALHIVNNVIGSALNTRARV